MAVTASALIDPETQATKSQLWRPPALFLHDWSTNLVVRTSYATAIAVANTAGAVRTGLNPKPTRSMDVVFLAMDQNETALLRSLLQRMNQARTPVPLFCDQTPLTASATSGATTVACDTTNRHFFVGAIAAVWPAAAASMASTFDLLTISAITGTGLTFSGALTNNYTSGAMIAPVMEADLVPQASAVYATDQQMNAQLTFRETVGPGSLDPLTAVGSTPTGVSTYLTYPILASALGNAGGHFAGNSQGGALRANETSQVGLFNYTEVHGRQQAAQTLEAMQLDRASAILLKRFFDSRGGQQKPFIVQDMTTDFSLASAVAGGDTVVHLSAVAPQLDWTWRTHLALVCAEGSIVIRGIAGLARAAGIDTVTLSSALPALPATAIGATAAFLGRFASDELAETWITDSTLNVQMPLVEVIDETSPALAHMPAFPVGGSLRASMIGGGVLTDYGVITPPYNHLGSAFWAGGASLPAGTYRVTYESGMVHWYTAPPFGSADAWSINWPFGSGDGAGYQLFSNGGGVSAGTPPGYAPGATGGFVSESAAAAAAFSPTLTFTHGGGPIDIAITGHTTGLNVLGTLGAPTWRLQRLS